MAQYNYSMKDIPAFLFEHMQQVERQVRRYVARLDGVAESAVLLPRNLPARLQLLNLMVWSKRYRVDIPFILGTLLNGHFSKARQRVLERAGKGRLGIGVPALCGRAAEQALQEQLILTPYQATPQALPVRRLNYETAESMVTAYSAVMRHRHLAQQQQHDYAVRSPRNWRGKA